MDARHRLSDHFALLGIEAATVPYPAHGTVEEGKALRGAMAGTFTKNLLLRDKKDRLFLVAVQEDRMVDLKTMHRRVGANGRMGFASGETMEALLGVSPGALTPLALLADVEGRVTCVLDATLMSEESLNFHPLINTESTNLSPADLVRFLTSCEHAPLIVDMDAVLAA